jgi:molybdopterin synthase catalytic subunit
MDYLKTEATFWKKEVIQGQSQWVDARSSDTIAKNRWT